MPTLANWTDQLLPLALLTFALLTGRHRKASPVYRRRSS